MTRAPCFIGCAGWTLPRDAQHAFSGTGSHLERYASRFNACEINSSFHRPHSLNTYRRWAESTPPGFRFSVKIPKAITHEHKLVGCVHLLEEFLAQACGLGDQLACLLVQLPPSLAFEGRSATDFVDALRARWTGDVAMEPRHASWFTPAADAVLRDFQVARVLADPVRHGDGARPGGWRELVYLRLHGSPRMYYSPYEPELINRLADRMELAQREAKAIWCMFDNTAAGAATDNALTLMQALEHRRS